MIFGPFSLHLLGFVVKDLIETVKVSSYRPQRQAGGLWNVISVKCEVLV